MLRARQAARAATLAAVLALGACSSSSGSPAHPEGYRSSEEPNALTVEVLTGQGDVVTEATADETGDEVRLTVTLRSTDEDRPDIGIVVEVVIALEQPLADRAVVDARTDEPLARLD